MSQFRAFIIALGVLLGSYIVRAVEVVQNSDIPKQAPAEPTIWTYLTPILIIALVVILVVALITYIIWRILQWLKQNESEFHRIITSKRDLAKKHASRMYYRSLLKKKKNAPIKCLYKDREGNIKTTVVGFYYGHYYSNGGTLYIAFSNSALHWLLPFIPKVELLMVNKNPSRTIRVKEEKKIMKSGKEKIVVEEVTVKLPTNIEHFQENEIILYAYGIDNLRTGEEVYAPVLFDERTGEIIKSELYLYSQLQDVLLQDVLFTQAEGYSKNTKKAIDYNASIKATQKLGDSNGEVVE